MESSEWAPSDARRRAAASSKGSARRKHASAGSYSFAQRMPQIVPTAPRSEFERSFPSLNEPQRRARPTYTLSDIPLGALPQDAAPDVRCSDTGVGHNAKRTVHCSAERKNATDEKSVKLSTSHGAAGIRAEIRAGSDNDLALQAQAQAQAERLRAADIVAGVRGGARNREEEEELERRRVREKIEHEQRMILKKLVPSSAVANGAQGARIHTREAVVGPKKQQQQQQPQQQYQQQQQQQLRSAAAGGKEVLKATGRIKVRSQRSGVESERNRAHVDGSEVNSEATPAMSAKAHGERESALRQATMYNALDEDAYAHDELTNSGGGILPQLPKSGDPRFDELFLMYTGNARYKDDCAELQ